jgi:hypothetical protein
MRSIGLVALSALVSCATTTEGLEPWVLDDEPVYLSSLVGGWRLFKGYEVKADGPVVGTPAEAFLKLVAVCDGVARICRTPHDLRGLVRLSSTNDALAFVRLFSDCDTFYLFGDDGFMEVAPTDSPERSFAEISRAEFGRLGLYPPRVQRVPAGFVISRCVARDTGGARGDVYGMEERVSTDGRYSVTRILIAKDVDIFVPGFW